MKYKNNTAHRLFEIKQPYKNAALVSTGNKVKLAVMQASSPKWLADAQED